MRAFPCFFKPIALDAMEDIDMLRRAKGVRKGWDRIHGRGCGYGTAKSMPGCG